MSYDPSVENIYSNLLSTYVASKLPNKQFDPKAFLQHCCNSLFDRTIACNADDQSDIVELQNVAMSAFVEAAKNNCDVSELKCQIKSTDPKTSDFAAGFCDVYSLNKEKLRSALSEVQWRYPRIVECEWKLDYQLKNNFREEIDKPHFTVSLKLNECNLNQTSDFKDFRFQCSSEQIQDLLWKLKEASKMIEKTASA